MPRQQPPPRDDSRYRVAFELMETIAESEGVNVTPGQTNATRAWILTTFAACIEACDGVPPSDDSLKHAATLVKRP